MPSIAKPKSRTGEILAVPAAAASVGLCSTCINSSSCVYRDARDRDAQYCEMFDAGNGSRPTPSTTLITTVKPGDREKAGQTKLKGLCVNCENRDTCTLPKAESGVWHCEEYQ